MNIKEAIFKKNNISLNCHFCWLSKELFRRKIIFHSLVISVKYEREYFCGKWYFVHLSFLLNIKVSLSKKNNILLICHFSRISKCLFRRKNNISLICYFSWIWKRIFLWKIIFYSFVIYIEYPRHSFDVKWYSIHFSFSLNIKEAILKKSNVSLIYHFRWISKTLFWGKFTFHSFILSVLVNKVSYSVLFFIGGSPRCIISNMHECYIIARKFEIQLPY